MFDLSGFLSQIFLDWNFQILFAGYTVLAKTLCFACLVRSPTVAVAGMRLGPGRLWQNGGADITMFWSTARAQEHQSSQRKPGVNPKKPWSQKKWIQMKVAEACVRVTNHGSRDVSPGPSYAKLVKMGEAAVGPWMRPPPLRHPWWLATGKSQSRL